MTAPPAIGTRLRALREATGHTRTSVARAMHVTLSAVANWELGHRQPTFTVVERYCHVIGMSIHIGPDDHAHTGTKERT